MLGKPDIRQRLTLQHLSLVTVIIIFFTLNIYLFTKLFLENRFFTRLHERAVITSSLYVDFGKNKEAIGNIVKNSENRTLTEESVSIYNPVSKKFLFSTNFLKEEFHRGFLNPKDTSSSINNISTKTEKVSTLKIKGYWIIISAKDVSEINALSDLREILIILAIVAILSMTFISWLMADRAISPIYNVGKQLEVIFPKNLSQRISYPNKQDEIGTLVNTINTLLKRVETSVNAQKIFIANISHELKNPLTKIFTQIEILEMKNRENTELTEALRSLRSDAHNLNQLTHSLLELAGMYSSEANLHLVPTRVDEVLFDAVSEYKRWNPEHTLDLDLSKFPDDEEIFVRPANAEALKIVFKNLINNGHKFSTNDKVAVKIYANGNKLQIDVFNEGIPIPKDQIKKVFEPFFRSDSTAKGKNGHGVGLAIVKQILALHHAQIILNPISSGNCFTIVFGRT